MAELKTKLNDADVKEFLRSVENDTRRQDGFTLLEMFTRLTGEQPKMWGSSIVGFGMYHYKSERSSQEGDWMINGFSPRKQNLALYVLDGSETQQALLAALGKHKAGKGCLYINKLADVDLSVLERIIEQSYHALKASHA